jgi:hypothetical protein
MNQADGDGDGPAHILHTARSADKTLYSICSRSEGASSSDSDVDRYVIITKLLDPVLKLLPVFSCTGRKCRLTQNSSSIWLLTQGTK